MAKFSEEDFIELSNLAKQAQDGDSIAYEEFLRRLYRLVEAVVRARLGSVANVEDIVQECLLAVHKSLATYQPSREFRPWIMAIIRYKLVDHFRSLSKLKEQSLTEEVISVTDCDSMANSMKEDSRVTADELVELCKALPEPLQRAVVMTKLQGFTCAEVAELEGISEPAIRKRVSRAYVRLAKACGKLEKNNDQG